MGLRRYSLIFIALLMVACGPSRESVNSEPMASEASETIDLENLEELGLKLVDDLLMEEGDIIVGELEERINEDGSVSTLGIRYRTKSWPGNSIAYKISSDFSNSEKSYIISKISNWNEQTDSNLRILPARDTDLDHVYVVKGTGCYSYVGRKGGRQHLSLGEGCLDGRVVEHEFGHAAGLEHEHNRCDRDDYVKIHWENIQSGFDYAFSKKCDGYENVGTYDFESAMHYWSNAWSINGKPTVTRLNGDPIQYNTVISDGDIHAIYRPIEDYISESLFGDLKGSNSSINCGSEGIKKISAKYGGWLDQLIVECHNGTTRSFGGSGGNTWDTIYPSSQPAAIKVNASKDFWGQLLEIRALGTFDNNGEDLEMAGNTTTAHTTGSIIPCPAGYFVSGLSVNYDNYIQAIGPICRRI